MAQAATVRTKGPLVWLDMDQQELDDAYDQAVYAPNRDQVHHRRQFNSARARAVLGEPLRFSGPSRFEGLDVYRTQRADAPVAVSSTPVAPGAATVRPNSLLAELFINAGANLVLDFANIDDVGGDHGHSEAGARRHRLGLQERAAIWRRSDKLTSAAIPPAGISPASCATTDWQRDFGLSKDVLKGALLASGMYDLKPVRLSKRSKYVKFTDEIEAELSSQRHLDRLNCPVILAYGTYETPEFQRQARDMAAALNAAGKPVTFLVGEGYNHFEMLETLASPYGLLGRPVLEMMGLKLRTAARIAESIRRFPRRCDSEGRIRGARR
jgi:arylformamidase